MGKGAQLVFLAGQLLPHLIQFSQQSVLVDSGTPKLAFQQRELFVENLLLGFAAGQLLLKLGDALLVGEVVVLEQGDGFLEPDYFFVADGYDFVVKVPFIGDAVQLELQLADVVGKGMPFF